MATPAATWEVFLGGAYKPYDDPVQRALELAFRCGDASADVTIRGTAYEVTLQGAQLQQRQKNDPTRTRKVRRVAPPSPPAPAPVLAPAAIPAAPAVAAPAAPAPAAAGKRKRDVGVTVLSWNACHLLPASGDNKTKLADTVALLPQWPDVIFVQEVHQHTRSGGKIDPAKTAAKLAKIGALLDDNGSSYYEFHAAAAVAGEDHAYVKGTGVFVRRAGPLAGGRFWQPDWDVDGHVCCWQHAAGLLVGCYLPTPTQRMRDAGKYTGQSQARVREDYDRHLKAMLLEHERRGELLAVLGDCNVTLALGSLDTTREFSGGEYSAGRRRFLSLIDECKLRDEWRARNPDARRFTSFQQRGGDGGPRQARVDLALVPQRLASAVRRVEILDADGTFTSGNYEKALRSDHVPILLEMSV